jgi:hypothetical protein
MLLCKSSGNLSSLFFLLSCWWIMSSYWADYCSSKCCTRNRTLMVQSPSLSCYRASPGSCPIHRRSCWWLS